MKKINQDKVINYFRGLIIRVLLLVIIFLGLAIACKKNINYKNLIVSYIYEDNLSFAKMKSYYYKYLGNVIPFDKNNKDTTAVFNEEFEYISDSKYMDGGKLEVTESYLVPSLSEGMVIFVGEKEGYGNVIVVSSIDDINYLYGNIGDSQLKLYDYISKGDNIGIAKSNYVYLACSSKNQFIDYKECLV